MPAVVRRQSRRRLIGWGLAAAVLVIVPVVVNLLREPEYRQSVNLYPQRVGPFPALRTPQLYRTLLLTDPELHREMRRNAAAEPSEYADATFATRTEGARPVVVVTVGADLPERAARIVVALGPQFAGATKRQVARAAARRAQAIRAQLTGPRRARGRAVRRRLRRALREFERLAAEPVERVVLGAPAPPPPRARWVDRFADSLPGPTPDRADPLRAGCAGALVALILWAAALVMFPPRREPDEGDPDDRAGASHVAATGAPHADGG